MKMTEREFLLDAFWVITQIKPNGSHEEWKEEQGLGIDLWLEYFHKTYYEVEFVRKDLVEEVAKVIEKGEVNE